MSIKLNSDQIKEIFKDKKVILVGPANNLIGEGKGEFIDSFDIVCRLNDSYVISEERQIDYGKKCDILLNTCNLQLLCIMNRHREYLKDCKIVINPTSKVHGQDNRITGKNVYENYNLIQLNTPFYQVEGRYESNMNRKGYNTGMCALDFLINEVPLKSLYICGFSFHGCKEEKYFMNDLVKESKTYLFDYNTVVKGCDNPYCFCKARSDSAFSTKECELKQLDFFKNIIANKNHVTVDDTINKLLI